MSEAASPEDSMALSGKIAQLKAVYEALERHAAARKKGLDDGLEQVGIWRDSAIDIHVQCVHVDIHYRVFSCV